MVKLLETTTLIFMRSVFLKYQALFLSVEHTAMSKTGWVCVDISTFMDPVRLMSGKKTRNKSIGKI